MPSWVPLLFLISAPPWSSSSQVVGPWACPRRPQRGPVVAGVGHPAGRVGVVAAGGRVEAGLLAQLQLLAPALGGLVGDVLEVEDAGLELRQRGDVLDHVVTLAGLDLGRDPGRDLGVVDVVDGHVDPDLLAPVLGEGAEPLVVAGHEVAPEQDLEVTRELGPRLGEADRRRLAGRLLRRRRGRRRPARWCRRRSPPPCPRPPPPAGTVAGRVSTGDLIGIRCRPCAQPPLARSLGVVRAPTSKGALYPGSARLCL